MIAPGSWLGVLGGGQLGRMFTWAAQSLGYRVMVLDPDSDCPAGRSADRHLCAGYDDDSALRQLGARCAGVTTEFERVPAYSLDLLAEHCIVRPGAYSLAVAQDRIREKALIRGVAQVAPHAAITARADIENADAGLFPGILKSAHEGYDGKGQIGVAGRAEAMRAFETLGAVPCVLEKRLTLQRELSVVLARSADGMMVHYPVAENQHVGGVLDLSVVPARVPSSVAASVVRIASELAVAMDYCGVLCVEFFLLPDGELVVNEIAPRPHNSGHYTLDACSVSQFEQQVRVLAGLPPGPVFMEPQAAVMVNLLGDLWRHGEPAWPSLLQLPGCRLHLYGKGEARPGRKMGHFTCVAGSPEDALRLAERARQALGPGSMTRPARHAA